MRRLCLVLMLWVGLPLATETLLASTFLSAEFREVVSEASTIVRGRVTDVRALRSPAGDVESAVTIAVETVLKGEADRFVTMHVPGGVIGRYRTVMVGAPVMRPGEQAVFFLKSAPGNTLRPVGLVQGVYRVTASPGSIGMVHAPVVPGVNTASSGRVIRGDVRRKALPVAEFESLVRLMLTRRPQ